MRSFASDVRDQFVAAGTIRGYEDFGSGVLVGKQNASGVGPTIGLAIVPIQSGLRARVSATVGVYHRGLGRAVGALRGLPAGHATVPVVSRPLSAVDVRAKSSYELAPGDGARGIDAIVDQADVAARTYAERTSTIRAIAERVLAGECGDPDAYLPLAYAAMGDDEAAEHALAAALARRRSRTDREAVAYRDFCAALSDRRGEISALLTGN